MDVLVVGSYNQDLCWRCGRFPRAGETVVGEFGSGPGGKGSNQAVAAARAGARTRFVGAVGKDGFAEAAKKFYRKERIDARLVAKAGRPTGAAGIYIAKGGENEIVVAPGANGLLRKRDVKASWIRGARVVVCQLESSVETTRQVLRTARRAGARTVLNPSPMGEGFDRRILKDVDILIPNESEFLSLVQRVPEAARLSDERFRSTSGCLAEALLTPLGLEELHGMCRAMGIPVVVITLGCHGCLVSEKGGFALLPAHEVEVVDTTGAGDAFVGAFAAELARNGGDVVGAAKFGNAGAALAATRDGAAGAMAGRKEIERLKQNRRGV